MKRDACIAALEELAAEHLNMARFLEADAALSDGDDTEWTDDEAAARLDLHHQMAADERCAAGACLAAVNHLRGVSPE